MFEQNIYQMVDDNNGKEIKEVLDTENNKIIWDRAVPTTTTPIVATRNANFVSLTQTGKCEQVSTPTPSAPVDIKCNNGKLVARYESGLPTGYQLLDWLSSTKSIETARPTTNNTEIRAKWYRARNNAQYLYVSDSGSALATNTTAYLSRTGNWRFGSDWYALDAVDQTMYESIQNKSGIWLNDTKIATYTNVGTFTSETNLRLLGTNQYSDTTQLYWLEHYESDVLVAKYLPVKQLSDNTYGFYDIIGGAFYTNAEATFSAGNAVDDPVEVVVVGTDEVLTVVGPSLIDNTPDGQGTFVSPSDQNTSRIYKAFPALTAGETYTVSIADPNDRWELLLQRKQGTSTDNVSGWVKSYTFVPDAGWEYGVAMRKSNSSVISPETYATEGVVLTLGTTQTASVVDLFGAGDTADTQEIISGAVRRKCAVRVLDGTENWGAGSSGTGYRKFSLEIPDLIPDGGSAASGFCSHYKWEYANTVGNFYFAASGSVLQIVEESSTSLSAFKAFLVAQFNNGTPVIVIYPLATETTEQVAAQPLTTARGTNTVTITSSNVSNVSYSVTYLGKD